MSAIQHSAQKLAERHRNKREANFHYYLQNITNVFHLLKVRCYTFREHFKALI